MAPTSGHEHGLSVRDQIERYRSSFIAVVAMILIAAAFSWSDFDQSNPLTWLFVGGLGFMLLAIVALYIGCEIHRRNMVGSAQRHSFSQ